jgi:ferredoxin
MGPAVRQFSRSEDEMMVMTIANGADCIGCGACGRVCPKDCYTYAAADE